MKKQFKIHIKNPLLKNERCYCGQQTENLILYDKIKFIYFKRDIIPKNISRYCLKMYKREQSRLDNIRYFARDEKERLKKKRISMADIWYCVVCGQAYSSRVKDRLLRNESLEDDHWTDPIWINLNSIFGCSKECVQKNHYATSFKHLEFFHRADFKRVFSVNDPQEWANNNERYRMCLLAKEIEEFVNERIKIKNILRRLL